MTPEKQKAIDLVERFRIIEGNDDIELTLKIGKHHALICVDEVIEIFADTNGADPRLLFYQSVRKEITRL